MKTEVGAEIAVEGEKGAATITRTWPDGADLTQSEASVRLPSKTGRTDLSALGWTQAMESYRPFLSYNELSAMFEGPTELHDRLSAILGLGQLDEAAKTLGTARLERDRELRSVRAELLPLVGRLRASDDPRAAAAARALGGRTWDLDAADATRSDAGTTFDRQAADELSILRALATLRTPPEDQVLQLAEQLRDLVERQAAFHGTPAGEARELAELLRSGARAPRAPRRRDLSGLRPGPLNADWRTRTGTKVAELREEAGEAAELERETRMTLGRVPLVLAAPPPVLERAADVGIDTGAVERAWSAYAAGGAPDEDLLALADHLESRIGPLVEAAGVVRATAQAEVDRREDAWRPLAVELGRWLATARAADARAARTKDLKSAEDWLKDDQRARSGAERFEPIATEAIAHWAALRQQSSVELERVMLEGTGNQRRVDLMVTVDGVEGAALGVMSQGELHAIALSLFLPRATLPESPFRFVVIDDPVQSMDPARVDGLARVLADVAKTRQVVVFTHDDRLPEAVRRLEHRRHRDRGGPARGLQGRVARIVRPGQAAP